MEFTQTGCSEATSEGASPATNNAKSRRRREFTKAATLPIIVRLYAGLPYSRRVGSKLIIPRSESHLTVVASSRTSVPTYLGSYFII
jgi:hypothetical protein